jgi:hypothetical protein
LTLKKLGAGALVIGTACIAAACSDQVRADALATDSVSPIACLPLKVAVIPDKSKSSPGMRTPEVAVDALEPLVNLIASCGGELGVSVIHDEIVTPFVRLRLDPPPQEPASSRARNVLRRRREQAQIDEAFREDFERWEADAVWRIEVFAEGVTPLLDHPADADWSPVWDAVTRADLFLGEAEAGPVHSARRVLLLVSDGIDDVRGRPTLRRTPLRTLKSGATVLIVNGAGTVGSLSALDPLPFESFEAALRHLEDFGTATPSATAHDRR